MGFGWLLVGYFFANIMSLYSELSFAMLAGYPLMLIGLWRLAPYHKRFYQCFFVTLPALPFALYFSLVATTKFGLLTAAPILQGSVYAVVEGIYFLYSFLLHVLLLLAISGLAAELGLLRHQSAALRNLVLIALYTVVYLIARLLPAEQQSLFVLPLILLRYLYIFLNLWLLFRCYRHICPEGDGMMFEPVEDAVEKEDDYEQS